PRAPRAPRPLFSARASRSGEPSLRHLRPFPVALRPGLPRRAVRARRLTGRGGRERGAAARRRCGAGGAGWRGGGAGGGGRETRSAEAGAAWCAAARRARDGVDKNAGRLRERVAAVEVAVLRAEAHADADAAAVKEVVERRRGALLAEARAAVGEAAG